MSTTIKVIGYHIDAFGHVNNARYLEFLEAARWDWLESYDAYRWFKQMDIAVVVVNININYRLPVYVGERLVIDSYLQHTGQKSGVLKQIITRQEDKQVVADAEVTFVFINMKTGKAIPIEGEIRDKFELLTGPKDS
ncbi:acyl-CoA thioesterase [Morganella morganii]|uniref:acyl-CoA thioesterase n=1 Tax=Morganella morganii TaxID=582 RepID=UPI00069BF990|nr:thioesterase family protein [Morganella morganii]KNZ88719.1 thioesterase [Morganella morganii]KOO20461.1 thioesterase [Morganella morganii]MDF2405854.1 YbgC/FadM family acyl-CoA thioesterase [Morganella morganii]HCR4030100.1 acyl-CoA thioesterase [Morganella morganii]